MVMKGGMLMALRYESSRFTKDADFSTTARYTKADEEEFLAELDVRLALANAESSYDTTCQIQSSKLKPAGSEKTFPTLAVTIGYAPRSNPRAIRRLVNKQSPNVVALEYSYNEAVLDAEVLALAGDDEIQVYSLVNLIAEKYRALLQQPQRDRYRYQDVYDLSLLLKEVTDWTQAERSSLYEYIVASCRSREIEPHLNSMSDPEVRDRAAKGYQDLQAEIDGPLPDFAETYAAVQAFYEGLPWPTQPESPSMR
jgi:predicted nucleotidyltransferase component of viral defense system